jgi:hypothetical protein
VADYCRSVVVHIQSESLWGDSSRPWGTRRRQSLESEESFERARARGREPTDEELSEPDPESESGTESDAESESELDDSESVPRGDFEELLQ